LKDCYDVNTDNKDELVFCLKGSGGKNASSISVSTSVRSGQNLHISEHGYICQKYPEKAEEIRTGALNAVEAGQMISIESTSKGSEGDFYNYCKKAMELEKAGTPLTKLDFKFFKRSGYRGQLKRYVRGIPFNSRGSVCLIDRGSVLLKSDDPRCCRESHHQCSVGSYRSRRYMVGFRCG
jgi:hypothetical protein